MPGGFYRTPTEASLTTQGGFTEEPAAGGVTCLISYGAALIAGGGFDHVGTTAARNVAAWNGETWEPLGDGVWSNGMRDWVSLLITFGNDLIAAGNISLSGQTAVRGIAAWNGQAWLPLGGGIDGSVLALTVYQGELIAAGNFTDAGGVYARSIAAWNGSTWRSIGSGFGGEVTALAVLDGDLIAGGLITLAGSDQVHALVRWNGTTWQALSTTGLHGSEVTTLALYNDRLICGTIVYRHGPDNPGDLYDVIARWNGTSWRPLGSGIPIENTSVSHPGITCLATSGGDLFAVGDFWRAGGKAASGFARWRN
jgi:hypothetical protein